MDVSVLIFSLGISLIWIIYVLWWMSKLLKYTKENRIIQSMTLKALLKYFESKGEKIDIEEIQKQVEKSVN